jgi:hypothetical protein
MLAKTLTTTTKMVPFQTTETKTTKCMRILSDETRGVVYIKIHHNGKGAVAKERERDCTYSSP